MVGSEESIDEQTTEIKPASPTFILIPQFKKLDIWRYQRLKLLQFVTNITLTVKLQNKDQD